MRFGRVTQKVEQLGRSLNHRLHVGVFAVEQAQGVQVQAAARLGVERIGVGLKVGDECGAVQIALFGLAQAVDLQLYAANAQFFPQRVSHQDEFGIQLGAAKAQRLGAHLVELAVAPALGPLVAEHGAKVIQALAAVVQKRVLDHRAHHTGGVFRAQGELLAVEPVFKRIHLFLNNVGHLAQAAHKQRGRLDDGGADVFIGVAAHQRAHPFFQRFPPG